MWPSHRQQNCRDANAANARLPLATDVEHPCVESDGDRKTCEDKVGGIVKRITNTEFAQSPRNHDLHGLNRIFADEHHNQT